jgi:hypothetical protein
VTKKQSVCKKAGITTRSFDRYAKKPGFPGADASEKALIKWIKANKSTRGRPPSIKTKARAKPSTKQSKAKKEEYDPNKDPDVLLRREKLRTDIEKNTAQAGKYLDKWMTEYREKMVKRFNSGMDILFREIARLELDQEELNRLKAAAEDAAVRIQMADETV